MDLRISSESIEELRIASIGGHSGIHISLAIVSEANIDFSELSVSATLRWIALDSNEELTNSVFDPSLAVKQHPEVQPGRC